jgi:hypothetical protein
MATINIAGRDWELKLHDFRYWNPNDAISNAVLKDEASRLPEVAELAKAGRLCLVTHLETELETWGLPNMDSADGRVFGAPIEIIEGPIRGERVIAGGVKSMDELQLDFLMAIEHPRFQELQRIAGAYQGPGQLNRNQLLDAFHLWCAEHAECDYFLSLDFKLQRMVSRSPRKPLCTLVRPSELLAATLGGPAA